MTRRDPSQAPVIVFGTSVTALAAIRSFRRLGIDVFVYTIPGDLVTLSKYYNPIPRPAGFDPAAPPVAQMESILRSLTFERAFLLPCTDLWSEAAAGLCEELKLRFRASIAPRETMAILLDKGKLASQMTALGLPHPRSFHLESEEDIDNIDEGVFESAFLKPKSSARFIAKFKVKALHVHSREEARLLFREATNANCEVILQEYVPGPPTRHYFIDGFIDKHGAVLARFARRRERMYPVDFGNSTFMKSVPLSDVAPAAKALDTLLSKLNYRGIFSAEFKYDDRYSNFYLLEVNVRPWWYLGFAQASRVPVCEMAYADAMDAPMPSMGDYPIGKSCIYPYFDLQEYFWRKRHSPNETRAPLLPRLWACVTSHQPIFAWDDPHPAIFNFLLVVRRFLVNKLWRKKT